MSNSLESLKKVKNHKYPIHPDLFLISFFCLLLAIDFYIFFELKELLAAVFLSVLILIRHSENFKRLLSRSEHSLGIGE